MSADYKLTNEDLLRSFDEYRHGGSCRDIRDFESYLDLLRSGKFIIVPSPNTEPLTWQQAADALRAGKTVTHTKPEHHIRYRVVGGKLTTFGVKVEAQYTGGVEMFENMMRFSEAPFFEVK